MSIKAFWLAADIKESVSETSYDEKLLITYIYIYLLHMYTCVYVFVYMCMYSEDARWWLYISKKRVPRIKSIPIDFWC